MLVLKNNFLIYPATPKTENGAIAGFELVDPHTAEPFTLTIPEDKRLRQKDWKDWLKDLGYVLGQKGK